MDAELGNVLMMIGTTLTVYVFQNDITGGSTFVGLSNSNGYSKCFALYPNGSPFYNNSVPGHFNYTDGLRYSVSISTKLSSLVQLRNVIPYLTNGLPSNGVYSYTTTFTNTSYAIKALEKAGITLLDRDGTPISNNSQFFSPYVFGNYLRVLSSSNNYTVNIQPGITPQNNDVGM